MVRRSGLRALRASGRDGARSVQRVCPPDEAERGHQRRLDETPACRSSTVWPVTNDSISTVREHERDVLVQQLDDLVADLRDHGVPVSPSSRLVQYARVLERLGARPRLARDQLALASHCFSEGSELIEVTGHLRAAPEVPGWRKLFRRVQGGGIKPSAKADAARDAQLELLVGAALKAAGAEVVFDEPDARATWEGHALAVAAKRVSSVEKLEKNVRKARNQIARTGLPGLIAVDFTMLLPGRDVLHVVPSAALAPGILDPDLQQGIAALGGRVTAWVQENENAAKNVLAVVGLARSRFVFQGPERPQFGTVRRLLGGEVVPAGEQVPEWVKRLVLRFNRIGTAPTSA